MPPPQTAVPIEQPAVTERQEAAPTPPREEPAPSPVAPPATQETPPTKEVEASITAVILQPSALAELERQWAEEDRVRNEQRQQQKTLMSKIRQRDERLKLWEMEKRRHVEEVRQANRDFELKTAMAELRLSKVMEDRGNQIRKDLIQLFDLQTTAFTTCGFVAKLWEEEAYWEKAAAKEKLHTALHLIQLRDSLAQTSGPWKPCKRRMLEKPNPKTAPRWMVEAYQRNLRKARQAAAAATTPAGPKPHAGPPLTGEVTQLAWLVRR